jgi:hypothetical protein
MGLVLQAVSMETSESLTAQGALASSSARSKQERPATMRASLLVLEL